jgi:hypothetical protein
MDISADTLTASVPETQRRAAAECSTALVGGYPNPDDLGAVTFQLDNFICPLHLLEIARGVIWQASTAISDHSCRQCHRTGRTSSGTWRIHLANAYADPRTARRRPGRI